MSTLRLVAAAAAILSLALLAACSSAPVGDSPPAAGEAPQSQPTTQTESKENPKRVDPRRGGLEIGLAEWALATEAEAIRPGKVTFLIRNRGTMGHGFEIELEGESSGSGSDDLFKAETNLLHPGESTKMKVTLGAGLYKIECLVDGHDDMGMERMFEVRRDAPLLKVGQPEKPNQVAIQDLAFTPATIKIAAGTKVTWRNDDSTDHTVTAIQGGFGSDALSSNQAFSHRFDRPGVFAYRCAIHPEMRGKVHVE